MISKQNRYLYSNKLLNKIATNNQSNLEKPLKKDLNIFKVIKSLESIKKIVSLVRTANFVCSLVLFFCFQIFLAPVNAHEIRPAYLEINELEANKIDITWKVPRINDLVPNIRPLFSYINIDYASEPVLVANSFVYKYKATEVKPLSGQNIRISGLENTLIDVLVKVNYKNGDVVTLLLQPSKVVGNIPSKSDSLSVIRNYTSLGIYHIWLGIDHLLFVLALIIITSGAWAIVKTITAFTIAHSITLSSAALGFVHVPGPPVEAIIALSIVFLAVEIINEINGKQTITSRKPWLVAFVFGLLHGLGFANALSEIGLPQSDIVLALAFFNVGVEIGQLCFVVLVLIIIKLMLSKINWKIWQKKIPAYVIGSMASFWLIDRVAGFFG